MNPDLLKRLVNAKYLFWQGCDTLDKKLPVSDGMAVLNFQDAVEMVLRTVAEHLQANVKETASFDQVIQEIEKTGRFSVPYRIPLNQLNKARVVFKHFGLDPTPDSVAKFRRDTELFFQDTIKGVFDLDFHHVSMIDLIKNPKVKYYLKQAETFIDSGDYQKSIISSAVAFPFIFHSVREQRRHREIDRLSHFWFNGIKDDETRKMGEFFRDIFFEQQQEINILKYGINFPDYHRFNSIIPNIGFTMVGIANIIFMGDRDSLDVLENARFCLHFATDSALLVRKNRPFGEIPLQISLRKIRVLEKAPILDFFDGETIPVRDAERGEILIGYYKNHDNKDYIAIIEDDNVAYIKRQAVEEIK